MDDMSSHVSMKIKSAIKAKLMELGTYVDNELPDYIMVLVVNKKTKEQMDNDLSLFLGHNTEHFTSWLTDVLEKLNSAAAINNASALVAVANDKSSEKEKELIKTKEEVKVSETIKDDVKKTDAKKETVSTKEINHKDKKKSKEKKQERKEKKRKKKEKKEIEKKLKKEAKEAKRIAALEESDKLNKQKSLNSNIASELKQTMAIEQSKLKAVGNFTITSDLAAKRVSCDRDISSIKEQSPMLKHTVVEAQVKNKTLTITKTIHNDHHKPAKAIEAVEKESNSSPISAAQKSVIVMEDTKTKVQGKKKKKIEEKSNDRLPEVDMKLESVKEKVKEHEEQFVEEIEDVEEEEIEDDRVDNEEHEIVEEEEEVEPVQDIVDVRVDAADKLDQELKENEIVEEEEEVEEIEEEEEEEEVEEEEVVEEEEEEEEVVEEEEVDGEVGNAEEQNNKASLNANQPKQVMDLKTQKGIRRPDAAKHHAQVVSVMDRLGPPCSSKRHRSSSDSDDRCHRDDTQHLHKKRAHDNQQGKRKDEEEGLSSKAKRRVVNLLEESSFPPRHPDKKQFSSKVIASVLPSRRLEACVRPMSVVLRTGRTVSPLPVRTPLASVVARHRQDDEMPGADGEDDQTSAPASVQSKVEVSTSSSRRGGASGSQSSTDRRTPNTALILRAVADAHRSVTTTANSGCKRSSGHLLHEEPRQGGKKPKLEVFSRSYREREEGRLTTITSGSSAAMRGGKLHKLSITVDNTPRQTQQRRSSSSSGDEEEGRAGGERGSRLRHSAPAPLRKRLSERIDPGSTLSSSSHRKSSRLPSSAVLHDGEAVPAVGVRSRLHTRPPTATAAPATPMEEVEEYIEEVEEWEEDVESVGRASVSDPVSVATPFNPALLLPLDDLVTQQTATHENKYITRCMFWPACRLGEKCQYQHPTVPCKTFPNCNYGDKCLYIHPNCKYDALCTRADCPYTHASPRSMTAINTVIPAKSMLSLNTTPYTSRPTGALTKRCNFGLKCTNVNCPFLHPRPCKYGSGCLTPGCLFTHPDFITGAKLKWVAPKLSAASVTDVSKTASAKPPIASDVSTAAAATTAATKTDVTAVAVKRKTEVESSGARVAANGCSTSKTTNSVVKHKIIPITAD